MTYFLILNILLCLIRVVPVGFDTLSQYEVEGIQVTDAYGSEDGYYIFAPLLGEPLSGHVVVFVHGYGALNPMVYGGWLRHLVESGHHVIYPRYQQNILSTSPADFVTNTATGIRNALDEIRTSAPQLHTDALYLCGHSYGGVIIANLATYWDSLDIPEPRIALLCEPGSGPFSGGVLDTYVGMHPTLQLAIVVGDNDATVGQSFGKKVFETAVNTPNRFLLWQYASSYDETHRVGASHYEPYALDPRFDNGIENLTTRRALRLARIDQVDTLGYWKIFSTLVEREKQNNTDPFTASEIEWLAALGTWPDGSAVRVMECFIPSLGEKPAYSK